MIDVVMTVTPEIERLPEPWSAGWFATVRATAHAHHLAEVERIRRKMAWLVPYEQQWGAT